MAQYRLNTRLFVARPLDETVAFFADAANLQKLTPPPGTLIDDTVLYSPIGGAAMHALMVKRDLERIFTFRQHEILKQLRVEAREPIAVSMARIYPP